MRHPLVGTALALVLAVVPTGGGSSPLATAASSPPGDAVTRRQGDPAAWAAWGIPPLPPPPDPPADPPLDLPVTGPVPVISTVPTPDRVVFITIDDGKEKDPAFVRMVTDLGVPVSMFLTRDLVQDDYAYFRPLQGLGNRIQNHTLTHPHLSTLTADQQQAEICGAQTVLTEQYGSAPLLFRPPYGDAARTEDLDHAVRACGPRAVVLWHATMQIHDLRYQEPDRRLRPGDILLAHFRGPAELNGSTMTDMFAELLRRIGEQGFAVARLEDYLGH
ncbi:polysaccharide deacetylase family protein [Kitasatospora sp. NPDC089913]|uniref:polysaccharide deacetylase family protein n=1 Tax=Kitasatospora sp. NPDC089913 TaxID=3364080 RepID=UPI00382D8E7C